LSFIGFAPKFFAPGQDFHADGEYLFALVMAMGVG
jgi:hypothetical protein